MGKTVREVLRVALVAGTFILAGPQAAALVAVVSRVAIPPQRSIKPVVSGLTGRLGLSHQTPQWLAVGETALPSEMMFWGTLAPDNKELSVILLHAPHAVHAYTGLKINGIATAYPTPTGDYSGILAIQTAIGTHTTNPFTDIKGGWTGPGRDLAMSHFRWTYDEEKLRSGLPQSIQFTAKGIAVYDPRRDSTRGGSGPMRANDQSTWAYEAGGVTLGDNPALVDLSYLIGWRKNGQLWAGQGESPDDIDMASYIAAANICDEIVTGPRRRYTINGIIPLSDVHNINRGRILSCCAGKPINSGGLLGLWVAHNDTSAPVMAFTGADIVESISWEPLPDTSIRNTARGSFLDPGNGWSAQPYLEVAPADLLAMDNGVELAEPIDFPMVTNAAQARALANIRLRESRQGTYAAPMRLKALGLQPTDIITQTLPQQAWAAKGFRVESMAIDGETVTLRCRAVQASDYALPGEAALTPVAPPNTMGFVPTFADGATRNRPRGTYDTGTTYERGDSVIFAGSTYELIVATSTGTAPPDASRWVLVAAAGSGPPGADGLEGVTVIVTNEAHVVPTAPDGSGGNYASAGGVMTLRRGATVLAPAFSIAAQSPNSGWASINSSTGVYSVTDPGANLGTATLRATVGGVNYDRTYTIAKTLQGVTGPNVTLVADAQAFTFTDGAADPGGQVITLQALLTNIAGTATWSASPAITLGGGGNTRTISAAAFGTNRQVTVEATLSGITDRVTIVRLERNVVAPNAANRVPFSRFEGERGWEIAPSSTVSSFTPLKQNIFQDRYFIETDATATIGNQDIFVSNQPDLQVFAGERLSLQGRVDGFSLIGPQPLFWQFRMEFYNSAGVVGDHVIASGAGNVTRETLHQSFAVVPAGATFAQMVLQVKSGGAGVFRAAVLEPMIASAIAGQSLHPAYTPGPNADDGADVTADAVPILTLPPTAIVRASAGGVPDTGQLPRVLQARVFRGGADVTGSTPLAISISPPGAASASIASNGEITITALPARVANITVTPTLAGLAAGTFAVERQDAPPPVSGGGGTGTSASTSTISSFAGSSFVSVASLTVTTGSGGSVSASAPLDISTASAGGGLSVFGKVQRFDGSSWIDIGSEASATGTIADGEPASITISGSAAGLGAAVSVPVRLVMRTGTSDRTVDCSGTFSVVGA